LRGAREAAELEAGDEGAQHVHVEVGAGGHGSVIPMLLLQIFDFSKAL
jgi:hypothetical protein